MESRWWRRWRSSGTKWEEGQRASDVEEEEDTDDSASKEKKAENRFKSLSFYSGTNKFPRQQSAGVHSRRREGGRKKKQKKVLNKQTNTHTHVQQQTDTPVVLLRRHIDMLRWSGEASWARVCVTAKERIEKERKLMPFECLDSGYAV